MDCFNVLADENRRRILTLLSRGECCVGDICATFDVSAPAISQHLKVLRQAGLVRMQADGQRRIYSFNPNGLAEIDTWLRETKQFWGSRLEALERELKKDEGTSEKCDE